MAWVKIKQAPKYSIDEHGNIRNDETGKMKRPFRNTRNGYLYVDLWENNTAKKRPIHRLLAETFIPNPDGKPTVDHIDGNRQNNHLGNLRWAFYAEQNSRFDTVGVRSQRIKVTHYKEKRNLRSGGHEEWLDVDEVLFFNRITDAAEHFSVSIANISLMLKNGTIGRRGKMRGYLFEYADGQRVTLP